MWFNHNLPDCLVLLLCSLFSTEQGALQNGINQLMLATLLNKSLSLLSVPSICSRGQALPSLLTLLSLHPTLERDLFFPPIGANSLRQIHIKQLNRNLHLSQAGHLPSVALLHWIGFRFSAIVSSRRGEEKPLVDNFVKQLTLWLDKEAQRPATQVIPGSWSEPWVYELTYEFHSEPGWAVPVDISAPLKTHANPDFLMPLIREYPDHTPPY